MSVYSRLDLCCSGSRSSRSRSNNLCSGQRKVAFYVVVCSLPPPTKKMRGPRTKRVLARTQFRGPENWHLSRGPRCKYDYGRAHFPAANPGPKRTENYAGFLEKWLPYADLRQRAGEDKLSHLLGLTTKAFDACV